jgi:heptosyltransferase-1
MEKEYAVIAPFTTRPQKHWNTAGWRGLSEALSGEFGWKTLLLGKGEEKTSREIAAARDVVNLSGKTTLAQAAALIRKASLLVGVDTGLTHMGIALKVPSVALFGSTCPYLDAGTDRATVVYKKMECSPCRRHPTCHGAFTCMNDISVEDVLGAVRRVRQKGELLL